MRVLFVFVLVALGIFRNGVSQHVTIHPPLGTLRFPTFAPAKCHPCEKHVEICASTFVVTLDLMINIPLFRIKVPLDLRMFYCFFEYS